VSAWCDRAACVGVDVEAFYPAESARQVPAEVAAVCGRCPVAEQCLTDALARDDVWHGIRAGLLPDQRQRMSRRRKAA
jgi:WhiB family redox-sensing transcriptional regulator